jgi:hypothetical protein
MKICDFCGYITMRDELIACPDCKEYKGWQPIQDADLDFMEHMFNEYDENIDGELSETRTVPHLHEEGEG